MPWLAKYAARPIASLFVRGGIFEFQHVLGEEFDVTSGAGIAQEQGSISVANHDEGARGNLHVYHDFLLVGYDIQAAQPPRAEFGKTDATIVVAINLAKAGVERVRRNVAVDTGHQRPELRQTYLAVAVCIRLFEQLFDFIESVSGVFHVMSPPVPETAHQHEYCRCRPAPRMRRTTDAAHPGNRGASAHESVCAEAFPFARRTIAARLSTVVDTHRPDGGPEREPRRAPASSRKGSTSCPPRHADPRGASPPRSCASPCSRC